MDANITEVLTTIAVLMVGWNVYLFATIHAIQKELYRYKLNIAKTVMVKQDVEKMVQDITNRLDGMEERIEQRIIFLLQNGVGNVSKRDH